MAGGQATAGGTAGINPLDPNAPVDPNAPKPLTLAQASPAQQQAMNAGPGGYIQSTTPQLTLASGGSSAPPSPSQAPLTLASATPAQQAAMNAGVGTNASIAASPQTPGQAGGSTAPVSPTTAQSSIPTPTVAAPSTPVDQLSLAEQEFGTYNQATDPAYQQSLREATSAAAGAGQLGSGQLRTSIGDLALARQNAQDVEQQQLFQGATAQQVQDAQTAYNQALSTQQAGVNTTTALGGLGVAQGQLGLATGEAIGNVGGQSTLGAGQLALAQTAQQTSAAQNQENIDLATKSLAQSGIQFNASLAQQQAQQAQQNAQFNASLAQSGAQFTQSLAQNAQQFGLSQTQQMALANLQNATANRSIDLSQAQGQSQMLLQLAAILGGPTGALNPDALAGIAKLFGVTIGGGTGTTGPTTPTGTAGTSGTQNGTAGTGTGQPIPDGNGGFVDSNGNPVDSTGKPIKQASDDLSLAGQSGLRLVGG